jgi:hypothetical protein
MTENIRQALITFTENVSTAIARSNGGKDVDWRAVIDSQEKLKAALLDCPVYEPAPGGIWKIRLPSGELATNN